MIFYELHLEQPSYRCISAGSVACSSVCKQPHIDDLVGSPTGVKYRLLVSCV
jgi:hypothetical protein